MDEKTKTFLKFYAPGNYILGWFTALQLEKVKGAIEQWPANEAVRTVVVFTILFGFSAFCLLKTIKATEQLMEK